MKASSFSRQLFCCLLGLTLIGCQKNGFIGKPSKDVSYRTPSSINNAFAGKKVHLDGLTLSKTANKVSADVQLLALVDNHCLKASQAVANFSNKGESQPLSQEAKRLSSTPQISSKRQAYSFQLSAETDIVELEERADQDHCLIGLEVDLQVSHFKTFNDTRVSDQKHLRAIDLGKAYDFFLSKSTGMTQDTIIAIIDTGVDYNHTDLKNVMWKSSASGTMGYDFVNNDSSPLDDNGHGTHVAGLAAAEANNQAGVMGVLGLRQKIMAIKALDKSGNGSTSGIVNAIRWAADQGADVINLSLGGKGTALSFLDAVQYATSKGSFVVASAGNDSVRITSQNFYSPGGYARSVNGMITVGSVDSQSGQRSSFSNYGTDYVDIGAPGSNGILSTFLGDKYEVRQGTSMSAPIVAGAAALALAYLRSNGINPTPAELETIFLDGAKIDTNVSSSFNSGRTLNLLSLAHHLNGNYILNSGGIYGL